MIAIQDTMDHNKEWLLSIANNYHCTVQELNYQGSVAYNLHIPLLDFRPDDECIIYATDNKLQYWSAGEHKFTDNKKFVVYNNNSLSVRNCSPNLCQLIVQDDNKEKDTLYIQSIF